MHWVVSFRFIIIKETFARELSSQKGLARKAVLGG